MLGSAKTKKKSGNTIQNVGGVFLHRVIKGTFFSEMNEQVDIQGEE